MFEYHAYRGREKAVENGWQDVYSIHHRYRICCDCGQYHVEEKAMAYPSIKGKTSKRRAWKKCGVIVSLQRCIVIPFRDKVACMLTLESEAPVQLLQVSKAPGEVK